MAELREICAWCDGAGLESDGKRPCWHCRGLGSRDVELFPGLAPCPECFESSGYMPRRVSGGYWEPDYAEADPNSPCWCCRGSGFIEASPAGLEDAEAIYGSALE